MRLKNAGKVMSAFQLIVIIQSISIIVLAIGSIYLFYNWKGHEHSYLVIFCISTLINNIGSLVEIISHSREEALLGIKFAYIGKVFIPLTFFLFVLQYCEINISKGLKLFMTLFHISIAVLVFTSPAHKLFYTSIIFTVEGLFPHNELGHGIMYNVYTVCLIFYFFAILTVIFRTLKKEKRKKRRIQLYYLLAGSICAISGFLIFLSGVTKGYDTTSLSYMICTIFLTIVLTKYDLLDTIELVHNYVVDNLSLGIAALDENDLIIYNNQPLLNIYPDFKSNGTHIVKHLIDSFHSKQVVKIDDKVYQPEYKELFKDSKYMGHIITLILRLTL